MAITRLFGALGSISATLLMLTSPASAAGLSSPEDAVTDWSGFYVGAQLGGAWTDSDWNYDNPNWFNTSGADLLFTRFGFDGSGVLGGGQAGFNYQTGVWVLGVEGSVAGADLEDSRLSPAFPESDRYSLTIDLLTTVTARLGYAQDRWLLYAKAGWAGAELDLTLLDHVTPVRAHANYWADGWTVGGGAEYAFGQRLSFAIEYDYADLDTGRHSTRCNCPSGLGGGTPIVDGDVAVQSVTARLNYRFSN
jgi:outer membrane immunogenic protein